MKNKFPRKKVQIEITFNSVLLKGEISYWSKDYEISLLEPFKASAGGHLMLAAPVRYVTTENPSKGIHDIKLLDIANDVLIELYEKGSQC